MQTKFVFFPRLFEQIFIIGSNGSAEEKTKAYIEALLRYNGEVRVVVSTKGKFVEGPGGRFFREDNPGLRPRGIPIRDLPKLNSLTFPPLLPQQEEGFQIATAALISDTTRAVFPPLLPEEIFLLDWLASMQAESPVFSYIQPILNCVITTGVMDYYTNYHSEGDLFRLETADAILFREDPSNHHYRVYPDFFQFVNLTRHQAYEILSAIGKKYKITHLLHLADEKTLLLRIDHAQFCLTYGEQGVFQRISLGFDIDDGFILKSFLLYEDKVENNFDGKVENNFPWLDRLNQFFEKWKNSGYEGAPLPKGIDLISLVFEELTCLLADFKKKPTESQREFYLAFTGLLHLMKLGQKKVDQQLEELGRLISTEDYCGLYLDNIDSLKHRQVAYYFAERLVYVEVDTKKLLLSEKYELQLLYLTDYACEVDEILARQIFFSLKQGKQGLTNASLAEQCEVDFVLSFAEFRRVRCLLFKEKHIEQEAITQEERRTLGGYENKRIAIYEQAVLEPSKVVIFVFKNRQITLDGREVNFFDSQVEDFFKLAEERRKYLMDKLDFSLSPSWYYYKKITQLPEYEALIKRIDVIKERLRNNTYFQNVGKNGHKIGTLESIKTFLSGEHNSYKETLTFLRSKEVSDSICESTSVLPVLFQGEVHSRALLGKLVTKLDELHKKEEQVSHSVDGRSPQV